MLNATFSLVLKHRAKICMLPIFFVLFAMVAGIVHDYHRVGWQMWKAVLFQPFFETFGVDIIMIIVRLHFLFCVLPNLDRWKHPTFLWTQANQNTTRALASRTWNTWKMCKKLDFQISISFQGYFNDVFLDVEVIYSTVALKSRCNS